MLVQWRTLEFALGGLNENNLHKKIHIYMLFTLFACHQIYRFDLPMREIQSFQNSKHSNRAKNDYDFFIVSLTHTDDVNLWMVNLTTFKNLSLIAVF